MFLFATTLQLFPVERPINYCHGLILNTLTFDLHPWQWRQAAKMVNGRRNLRRLNAVTFALEISVISKLLCLFIDRQNRFSHDNDGGQTPIAMV